MTIIYDYDIWITVKINIIEKLDQQSPVQSHYMIVNCSLGNLSFTLSTHYYFTSISYNFIFIGLFNQITVIISFLFPLQPQFKFN